MAVGIRDGEGARHRPSEAPPSGAAESSRARSDSRRIAAVIALALLAVSLRRHLRFARDVFRRRLKLAFTVLVLLRQLRKS